MPKVVEVPQSLRADHTVALHEVGTLEISSINYEMLLNTSVIKADSWHRFETIVWDFVGNEANLEYHSSLEECLQWHNDMVAALADNPWFYRDMVQRCKDYSYQRKVYRRA